MKQLLLILLVLTINLSCNDHKINTSKISEVSSIKYLYHNLLINWKDTMDLDRKKEILSLFQGLPAQIKGFEDIQIIELDTSSANYELLIIQKYTTEEALAAYQIHPDHLHIKEIAPPYLDHLLKFDYWK